MKEKKIKFSDVVDKEEFRKLPISEKTAVIDKYRNLTGQTKGRWS